MASRLRTPPAVLLMGPTASGKTAVALELARVLPVEIVSVDSALVYKSMNIGTAKPDAATLERTPHHLVDLIEPHESYSAARFRDDALAVMREITARGKTPLLVGGTMLYFKALLEGLNELPQADPQVRAKIDAMAADGGWPAVHARLKQVDPASGARLEPTDAQRIQRALEVYYITGKTISELLQRPRARSFPYAPVKIALVPSDRAELHRRIAQRFDCMLANGLVEELQTLRERCRLAPGLPSMRCVGYRQAWRYLEGEIDRAELRSSGIAATRQLAKRQLTWLRSMPDVAQFDCLQDDLVPQVIDHVRHALASMHGDREAQ